MEQKSMNKRKTPVFVYAVITICGVFIINKYGITLI